MEKEINGGGKARNLRMGEEYRDEKGAGKTRFENSACVHYRGGQMPLATNDKLSSSLTSMSLIGRAILTPIPVSCTVVETSLERATELVAYTTLRGTEQGMGHSE